MSRREQLTLGAMMLEILFIVFESLMTDLAQTLQDVSVLLIKITKIVMDGVSFLWLLGQLLLVLVEHFAFLQRHFTFFCQSLSSNTINIQILFKNRSDKK